MPWIDVAHGKQVRFHFAIGDPAHLGNFTVQEINVLTVMQNLQRGLNFKGTRNTKRYDDHQVTSTRTVKHLKSCEGVCCLQFISDVDE